MCFKPPIGQALSCNCYTMIAMQHFFVGYTKFNRAELDLLVPLQSVLHFVLFVIKFTLE